jgi:hypothetical protein
LSKTCHQKLVAPGKNQKKSELYEEEEELEEEEEEEEEEEDWYSLDQVPTTSHLVKITCLTPFSAIGTPKFIQIRTQNRTCRRSLSKRVTRVMIN